VKQVEDENPAGVVRNGVPIHVGVRAVLDLDARDVLLRAIVAHEDVL
jgi:hypothetical protein